MSSLSVASSPVASQSPFPATALQDSQAAQDTAAAQVDADNSFSSHLQNASSSESSSSNQSTTPSRADRSKASNNSRSNEKPERPKNAANPATLLGVQVPYQQVFDDRKLQLSLDQAAGQDQAKKGFSALAGGASESAKAAQANPNPAANQNKGGVAFGANVHMDSTELSQSGTKNGTQAIADTKNSGSKNHQQDSSNDEDSGAAKKNVIAASTANSNVAAAGTLHAAPTMSAGAVTAAEHVQTAYAANAASKPVEAAPVASTAEIVDTPAPVAGNKSIDIQVGSADDNAVNVRVSQRAGDVQVTVRTPDTDLAQSLRQHLPELSDRLAQSGVSGDLWQPSTSSATNDQSSDSGSREESPAGQNAFSDPQSNQKQQDKNQSAWLNQMYDAEATH